MPPKAKKRKVKESEEEVLLQEKLTEAFFKYRYEAETEEEDGNVGMFATEEDEMPKIHVSDMERVAEDVGVEWDEAVMSLLGLEQRQKGIIDMGTMKLIIATLKVKFESIILNTYTPSL